MNKKAKIALFIPSLHGGGAERVVANLANGFVNRGYAVDLVLIKKEGPYLEQLSDEVRVVGLNISRLRYCLPALMRYIKTEKPDAMISSMGGPNLFSILARKFTGSHFPLVVRVENTESVSLRYRRGFWGKILNKIIVCLYRYANFIVAVSEGVKNDLLQNFVLKNDNVFTIYNPIVDDKLLSMVEREVGLTFWGENESSPFVIAVGRLHLQKDYPTLIRAFKILRENQDVRLLILGEGEERENLERLILELDLQDDVKLAGFVKNPFAYMKKASLFVLSSVYEGFGNVLVEAMACGTPVVSTDCPSGPSEILENGKWGKLVPVADPEALAKAMEESLNSPEKPDVRKRAMDFTVDKAVREHLKILFGTP